MITCEERKNRLLKANNLMKRLNLNSILVVGNGSVATNEYGFYRYFVDNRVYYHRQALVIVADETPTVCCGSLTHLKALNERGFWDVRMVGDRLAEGLVDHRYCQDTAYVLWPVQHLYVFPGDVHVGFSSSGYSYPHFGTGCNGHRH